MEHSSRSQNLNLTYCRASMSKRFANYLIDMIVVYLVVFFIGFLVAIVFPDFVNYFDEDILFDRLLGMIFYFLIMFIIEASTNGKSLGKIITKTRAVNRDGSAISIDVCFVRNLIRIVPFEPLTALGSPTKPWHDQWSHTLVVDEKIWELEFRKKDFFNNLKSDKVSHEISEPGTIEAEPH